MRNRIGAFLVVGTLIGVGFSAATLFENHLERNGVSQRWEQANASLEIRRTGPMITRGDDGAGSTPLDPTSSRTWARENWYYNYSNAIRVGVGPALNTSQLRASSKPVSGSAFRVLVVGDSYIAGSSVADTDTLWWKQLQFELDEQRGPGVFEVSALGKPGASTMEEAEWLTDELLAEYKPDVILLGYVHNDQSPSFREYSVCEGVFPCRKGSPESHPLYQACLRGQAGLVSRVVHQVLSAEFPNITDKLLERYCDLDRVAGELNQISQSELRAHPTLSPYFPLWRDALRRLAEIDKNTRVIVVPTGGSGDQENLFLEAKGFIQEAGLEVTRMSVTADLYRDFRGKGLQMLLESNPGDRHPGAPLTNAYARDATTAVLSVYDSGGVAPGAGDRAATPSLLSNYLPVTAQVTSSDNEATFDLGADHSWKSSGMVFQKSPPPNQTVPCAALGRPHSRLMMDPSLETGTQVLLQHRSGPVLHVTAVGYDTDTNAVVQRELGALRPGSALVLDVGPTLRGVLISTTRNGTCAADIEPVIERFSVSIKKS